MSVTYRRVYTPAFIDDFLEARVATLLARISITLPFWWSGFENILHPVGALSEIHSMGLPASLLLYALLLLVQFGGSFAIIANRYAWLGAGVLAVFTGLATVLAHAFWRLEGEACTNELNVCMEHFALIGGLFFAAMQSRVRRGKDAHARFY
jgi:transmembrane protein